MIEDSDIKLLIAELSALRIRVGHLESELSNLRAHDEVRLQSNGATVTLTRGDRVRIINAIKRPASWTKRWDSNTNERERLATVTHTTPTQVWLITDNGTKTWRAHKNVRRL